MPETNWLEQRKQTRQEPHRNRNTSIITSAATKGLVYLAYWAIRACLSEGDMGEMYFGETVTSSQFAKQLLINRHIRGDSGCIRTSLSWHRQERSLWPYMRQELESSKGMRVRSWWSWARLCGLWTCSWCRQSWLLDMLGNLLVLLLQQDSLIVHHGI